jgi:hypothetical protein
MMRAINGSASLRKKTTFPLYSPFFETHLSHDCDEERIVIETLGGWE